MYLVVDPSKKEQIKYYLFNNNSFFFCQKKAKSSDFLEALDKFLNENNVKIKNLSGIALVIGKGRFTSTRIAVVISNLIGFEYDLSLVEIESFSKNKKQRVASKINSSSATYISAKYSGEPNIN